MQTSLQMDSREPDDPHRRSPERTPATLLPTPKVQQRKRKNPYLPDDDEENDQDCGIAGPIEEDFLEECKHCFGTIYFPEAARWCSGNVIGRNYCN